MNIQSVDTKERFQFYHSLKTNPLASASASFIATVFLIIVLFVVAIKPTVSIITSLRNQIVDLESANSKLEKKISSLNVVVPEYRKLGNEIELINTALPNSHNFPTLEKQIRYLVTKNDLALSSLYMSGFPVVGNTDQLLQNKNAASDINTALGENLQIMFITINLNLSGDYTVIKSFVNDLQKLLRVTTIDQLTIKSLKKSRGSDVEVNLKGNVYYLADKTKL